MLGAVRKTKKPPSGRKMLEQILFFACKIPSEILFSDFGASRMHVKSKCLHLISNVNSHKKRKLYETAMTVGIRKGCQREFQLPSVLKCELVSSTFGRFTADFVISIFLDKCKFKADYLSGYNGENFQVQFVL